jgi:hypothetical protein
MHDEIGGFALFMNGAQGGMITADNRDLGSPRDVSRAVWNDHRTWDECLRIGHLMADEAPRIVSDAVNSSSRSQSVRNSLWLRRFIPVYCFRCKSIAPYSIATSGDEGVIQQIPWRIVNDSVTVSA